MVKNLVAEKHLLDARALLGQINRFETGFDALQTGVQQWAHFQPAFEAMLQHPGVNSQFAQNARVHLTEWSDFQDQWHRQQQLFTELNESVYRPLERARGLMRQQDYTQMMRAVETQNYTAAHTILNRVDTHSKSIGKVFSTTFNRLSRNHDLDSVRDALQRHERLFSHGRPVITPDQMPAMEDSIAQDIESLQPVLQRYIDSFDNMSGLPAVRNRLDQFVKNPGSLSDQDAQDLIDDSRPICGTAHARSDIMDEMLAGIAAADPALAPLYYNRGALRASALAPATQTTTRSRTLQQRLNAIEKDYEDRREWWAKRLKQTRDTIEYWDRIDKDQMKLLKGDGTNPGLEAENKKLHRIDNIVEKNIRRYNKRVTKPLSDLYNDRKSLQARINNPFGGHVFNGHSIMGSQHTTILKIEDYLRKGQTFKAKCALLAMNANIFKNSWLFLTNRKQYKKFQQDREFLKQAIADSKTMHKGLGQNQKQIKRGEARTASALYKLSRNEDVQNHIKRHGAASPEFRFMQEISDKGLTAREVRQRLTLNNGAGGTSADITLQSLNKSVDKLCDDAGKKTHETRRKMADAQNHRADVYQLHTSLRTLTRYELMKTDGGRARDTMDSLRTANAHMSDGEFEKLLDQADARKKRWALDGKIDEKMDVVVNTATGAAKDFDPHTFNGEILPEDLLAVGHGILPSLRSIFPLKSADQAGESEIRRDLSQIRRDFADTNKAERKSLGKEWSSKKKKGPPAPKTVIT